MRTPSWRPGSRSRGPSASVPASHRSASRLRRGGGGGSIGATGRSPRYSTPRASFPALAPGPAPLSGLGAPPGRDDGVGATARDGVVAAAPVVGAVGGGGSDRLVGTSLAEIRASRSGRIGASPIRLLVIPTTRAESPRQTPSGPAVLGVHDQTSWERRAVGGGRAPAARGAAEAEGRAPAVRRPTRPGGHRVRGSWSGVGWERLPREAFGCAGVTPPDRVRARAAAGAGCVTGTPPACWAKGARPPPRCTGSCSSGWPRRTRSTGAGPRSTAHGSRPKVALVAGDEERPEPHRPRPPGLRRRHLPARA